MTQREMKITADLIREVREVTGAPILRAKKVLEEVSGNREKAVEILMREGFDKVEKKAGRSTEQGLVVAYTHHTGKIAALVEVLCETDFVAKNELFVKLGNELAMQVASMNPKDSKELAGQDFIKDPSKKIEDLVREVITKTGENVRIGRVTRFEIGE
jgi:elongation factor Ts